MNQPNSTCNYDVIKELAGQERFFSKEEIKRLDRSGLSVAFFQSFWNSYIWAFVIGLQSDIDLLSEQLNADRTSVAAWPFRFKEHEEFLSKIGYFVWLADSPVPLDYNTRIRIQKNDGEWIFNNDPIRAESKSEAFQKAWLTIYRLCEPRECKSIEIEVEPFPRGWWSWQGEKPAVKTQVGKRFFFVK
jgi:hypothetical protein